METEKDVDSTSKAKSVQTDSEEELFEIRKLPNGNVVRVPIKEKKIEE